jgi:hypothetical protein
MFKTVLPYYSSSGFVSFGHLNFGHSSLPFDLAQGGELVEPFRVSDLNRIVKQNMASDSTCCIEK